MKWSAFLPFLAALLLATVSAQTTCSAIEENIDYAGNDIEETTRSSAADCCADCANTPGCTVYSWEKIGTSPGTCFLKSRPANKVYLLGSRSGKVVLPTATCTTIQENTDLPGNDMGDPLQLDTVGQCCSYCAYTKGCVAYVWVLRNNVGTCLLKSSRGKPTAHQGARAAYVSNSPPVPSPAPTEETCSAIEENIDDAGNDIEETTRSSAADCCADCANTPGCTVYSWEKIGTSPGTCFLKSRPANKVYLQGSRSGKVVLPTATCTTIQENTDLPGNDMGDPLQLDTVGQCCSYCAYTKGCVAYVWVLRNNVGTCLLKSSRGKPTAHQGARAAYVSNSPPVPSPAPTPAPTSASGQCGPILANTDFIGNDIVTLQRDTTALCCTECLATSGCKAFVWVLRDGVGTCILKSAAGSASTFPGASASIMVLPTPAPTPSPCPVVEYDVDSVGNNILVTSRKDYRDCCGDCQATVGCSLYVWGPDFGGRCYLKSKKGAASAYTGSRAGVLSLTDPIKPISNVKAGLYGVNSLPPTAFNFIVGAQWIDQGTLTAVHTQVESFVATNMANNFSHASGPVASNTLELALSLTVYINVTSAGECADMTATYKNSFFTYWPTKLYCIIHIHTAATTLQMVTATGQAITFPQDSDPAYLSAALANVATNADCVQACKAKGNCAGVEYASAAKTCKLYQPQPARFSDVVAGWVYDPVSNVDSGGVQYSQMTMSALPARYVKESIPAVASLQACASSAKTKAYTLFGYKANTKVCVMYAPIASATKKLSLVNTPLVPVLLAGAFGSDVVSGAMTASTASDCYKLCVPSQNLCFASVFDSATKTCTYVQPSFDAASTLGWIIPKTLPDTMVTVNQVDFYVTAHQDDHELFMSAPVYNSIKTPTTKSVFVYLSAGDAGETSGWWQARETVTLAATKTWINMFGVYSPVPRVETVLMNGHHIQKISIGNAVHYFLRLSENNLGLVLNSNQRKAPMDQTAEYYIGAPAVKRVLISILVAEATKVPKVTAHYSNYLIDTSGDHVLHVATGRITAELLNADALFSSYVSQVPYFGYQRWLDAVNMVDPENSAQRAIWLGLGAGILSQYPRATWSDHSEALGRTYMGSLVTKTTPCAFQAYLTLLNAYLHRQPIAICINSYLQYCPAIVNLTGT